MRTQESRNPTNPPQLMFLNNLGISLSLISKFLVAVHTHFSLFSNQQKFIQLMLLDLIFQYLHPHPHNLSLFNRLHYKHGPYIPHRYKFFISQYLKSFRLSKHISFHRISLHKAVTLTILQAQGLLLDLQPSPRSI